MLCLLSACGDQPKVSGNQPKITWEYPVGSSPARFQICHVAKGQTEEVCRNVGTPTPQSRGDKVLYAVSLTRDESTAERIGVVACERTCSAVTWVSADVRSGQ